MSPVSALKPALSTAALNPCAVRNPMLIVSEVTPGAVPAGPAVRGPVVGELGSAPARDDAVVRWALVPGESSRACSTPAELVVTSLVPLSSLSSVRAGPPARSSGNFDPHAADA